jgi:hypothetical protein
MNVYAAKVTDTKHPKKREIMLILPPSESDNLMCNKLETSRKLPFGLCRKGFIILHGLKEADT